MNRELSALLGAAINRKTKPIGSFGMLEILAKQLVLIQSKVRPSVDRPAILVPYLLSIRPRIFYATWRPAGPLKSARKSAKA